MIDQKNKITENQTTLCTSLRITLQNKFLDFLNVEVSSALAFSLSWHRRTLGFFLSYPPSKVQREEGGDKDGDGHVERKTYSERTLWNGVYYHFSLPFKRRNWCFGRFTEFLCYRDCFFVSGHSNLLTNKHGDIPRRSVHMQDIQKDRN